jgi:hypothetical protein
MDRGLSNSNSDTIEQFIENIVNTDAGFGELPYDILTIFAQTMQEQFDTLPTPLDKNWETVMELASIALIDDPED